MSRWAWLATFAIGCGHPSAPASPSTGHGSNAAAVDAAVAAPIALDNDLPRLAERGVKLFLDWAVALRESNGDCAVATSKLDTIANANTDVIEANRKVLRGERARIKALREEIAKHQTELDAAAKEIAESPTMKKCSTDPAFAKAADRLGGER